MIGPKTRDELIQRLKELDEEQKEERNQIREQLRLIRESCTHPRMPKREIGEEYQDWCPDCGEMRYSYRF